jgi:hypothetical protein
VIGPDGVVDVELIRREPVFVISDHGDEDRGDRQVLLPGEFPL